MKKMNLSGLTITQLEELMTELDQPRYRSEQLFNWIYKSRISSFEEMTNFPKSVRSRLNEIATIGSLSIKDVQTSANEDSSKYLFELADGLCVESVFMQDGKRITVCLSSQVGCALNCDFCATAKMGFKRNLTCAEIVDQLLTIQRHRVNDVTNVVLMGMGEPFLNYDNVLEACDLISNDRGIAIGKRKITISTSGIIPAITRFTDEKHTYKLAISLNASNDRVRDRLMPVNRKYPIKELMNAAKYYSERSNQRITFEYVLIKNVNDTEDDAARLKHLFREMRCKLNIIPYNPVNGKYERPSESTINAFIKPFLDMNIVVSVRRSKGTEIDAACGQLYSRALKQPIQE
ncbi:MAG: 23S rRNA (adenine(2503)-C(2))-methyltransferase RlmN [candidate division KSB1 bacterium]|jgi:23S rRNA (adenine2503-C2)-methyltransferase|nr:23S rRNA (adenine(2503)-C(2))-methyltransferase RlmN [candidate division KSB1 bacterium]